MSRLIDADALMDRMYHDAFETDTDMQKWDSGCWIRYKMFENAIDEAPTIDAVEVVRGEWISLHNGKWKCSECGIEVLIYAKGNFCPNCGAKMDGERKESE